MPIQSRKLVLEFTKMSGTGNDFIVVDNRFYNYSDQELSEMAKKLCQRRLSVGADGLLGLGNPITEGAKYRMSYYNADGSLGTMCGNGARCLARFAHDAGIEGARSIESGAHGNSHTYLFDSDAGLYTAVVDSKTTRVRLYVPKPQRFTADIQLDASLSANPLTYHFMWTGTEHLVLHVEDVQSLDLAKVGPMLRYDAKLMPKGANINFAEVLSDGTLRVRTYEKGVEAETLACGTGSIACAIVSTMVGKLSKSPVTVRMPGGDLEVGWEGEAEDPERVYLEGTVEIVYRATTEI
ncbi:MAG: diaminopimelate epimerase [Bacteroidetes bacterium]|nr:diaminopimelate epimerase [Bacteroidota bacterium]